MENVNNDPDYIIASDDTESEICVPLFDQGKVVGIINIESTVDKP